MGLVYYAAYNFFLKRKDTAQAEAFLGMYQNLIDQYTETYSSKTTGVVFTKQAGEVWNIFGIPPSNLTG
jgi:hypothetical protein